jgi:hypothetical protein
MKPSLSTGSNPPGDLSTPRPRPWEIEPRLSAWSRGRRRAARVVRKLAFNAWRTVPGILLYHFFPLKTVCMIVSPMRSGSTLLKALLAEAEDVSNLPEVDTWRYKRCNRYAVYGHVARLCREPVVVLKRPGTPWIPLPPSFLRLKVIVLCRDLAGVAASVEKMTAKAHDVFTEPWTREDAVEYWCVVYEDILANERLWQHDVRLLRYEDLLADPLGTTCDLFEFLGSKQRQGVDCYRKPEKYDWQWGTDDGGETIRTLKVKRVPREDGSIPPPGWEKHYALPRVERLRDKLGYLR